MIGMPIPPDPTANPPAPSAPAPKGRGKVLGCLAVVVVLGLLLIIWLGGWWNRRQTDQRTELAQFHHLRRVEQDRLRNSAAAGTAGVGRTAAVSPEQVRAGEVFAERARELYEEKDWAGVIQCIGLLDDLSADDPALSLMLESALFNRALLLLRQGQAAPALECLGALQQRRPMDRQANDLRSIGLTIRNFGTDQRTAEELERFTERQ